MQLPSSFPSTRAALLGLLLLPQTAALAQMRTRDPGIATMSTTTPGGPPPGSVRLETTPVSVRLRWTCPAGAVGYEVHAAPPGGAAVNLTPTPIGPQCIQDLALAVQPQGAIRLPPSQPAYQTSFLHGNLVPGMEFSYRIRALFATGGPADAPPIVGRPAPWPAPANPAVTPQPARGVVLTWSPVPGVSSYQVLRKLEAEPAFRLLTPTPLAGPPYADNTPLPPGRHEFQVRAVHGTPSAPLVVTMGPWPAPADLRASLNDRTVTLHWSPVPGVTEYRIHRKGEFQTTTQQVGATGQNGFAEFSVPIGRQDYTVAAVGGQPAGPVSVLLGKPQAGARPYRGTTVFDLGWFGTGPATGIAILEAPTPAGPYADVSATFERPTPTLARQRRAVTSATRYYKVVASYPPSVYPPLRIESDPVAVTFPKPPQGPANLTAQAAAWDPKGPQPPAAFVVHLKWTCDPEATGYRIMVGRTGQAREYIMGRDRPLEIRACFFGAGPLRGTVGESYTYAVIAIYPDADTVAEASVPVILVP